MVSYPSGMDHSLYAYSPLPKRERLAWPHDANLAICINLFFETMSYAPRPGSLQDVRWKERFEHDCRMYTWYEYGNRVGIFRILPLLDKYGLKATVAANAEACERFPYLVGEFVRRGYEIVPHGLAANEIISSRMPQDVERSAIAEAIDRVRGTTGTESRGWISQDYVASLRLTGLLAEHGVRYVVDWPNDEQPYLMSGSHLVSIPNYAEWDDMRLLWDRRLQMPRYPQIVGDAFTQLYRDGADNGRVFSINIHPWLLGAAHRIRYLEAVIDKIVAMPKLWHVTAGEIVDHILAQHKPA